jgi:hypothetical protein
MNEPFEFAQESTGKITAKQLLDVARQGRSHMYVHGFAAPNRASYSDAFIFRFTAKKDDSVAHVIEIPGWVSNGHTSERRTHVSKDDGHRWTTYCETYRPLCGFWSLSYCDTLINTLELLPRDAEIGLLVYLDAGTNGYLINAKVEGDGLREDGLHCDKLYLVATWTQRGKRVRKDFLIDETIGAHNSARFGRPRNNRDSKWST